MPKYNDDADMNQIIAEGLITGSPDGLIEKSEARGQMALVHSDDLPKDIYGNTFAEIEAGTGIKFGEQINDLFVAATLPEGWSKRPTNHSMHTDLVDEKGRVRATIFYKAAFYDRAAHMGFNKFYVVTQKTEDSAGHPRYLADGENPEYDGKEHCRVIVENGEGAAVHDAGLVAIPGYDKNNWLDARHKVDALSAEAKEWLEAEYPEHTSPFAYWD